MCLLQFIWREIKQVFLHSPSPSWKDSLGPALLGGGVGRGRFLYHGIVSSEWNLLSLCCLVLLETGAEKRSCCLSRGKSKSWALKRRVGVWADPASWPGPERCPWWRTPEKYLWAYLSSEQISSVAVLDMTDPQCRNLTLVMPSGLNLAPEFYF